VGFSLTLVWFGELAVDRRRCQHKLQVVDIFDISLRNVDWGLLHRKWFVGESFVQRLRNQEIPLTYGYGLLSKWLAMSELEGGDC
jgi:hypothetical protein